MRPVYALLPLGLTLLVYTGCRIDTEDTGNRAPIAPEISITPNPANTLDDLIVVIDVESADPDGDDVMYEYVWRRDGNVEDITEATVPADLTLKGQLWQVSVTATDGERASEPATASLTLGNAAPTIGNVTITPDTPTAMDTLQCIAQDVVDPDGEPTNVSYGWVVDGVPSAVRESTLLPKHFARGQEVVCNATANDPSLVGPEVVSAPVVIGDTAPGLPKAQIVPEYPKTGDTLRVNLLSDATDIDGDTVTYRYAWSVDGEDAGLTTDSVPAERTERGQTWTVEVYPQDDKLEGAPLSLSTYIENTLPTVLEVGLSPSSPTVADDIECTPLVVADADGDDVTLRYLWEVGGSFIGHSDPILTSADFAKGDTVTCSLVPSDPYGDGELVSSGTLLVGNAMPTVTTVTIYPDAPKEEDLITCVGEGIDRDGDTVTFSWTWWVNDDIVSGVSEGQLTGESFDKGDTVRCGATPSDGETIGWPLSGETVTVVNTPPGQEEPVITPDPAYSGDLLTCEAAPPTDVDPADADSLTQAFTWIVNGLPVEGATESTLSMDGYPRATEVICTARPIDSEASGLAILSEPLVLSNTAPFIDTITLTPEEAREEDTLNCGVLASDVDGDSTDITITWTVDRDPAPVVGATLDGRYFDKGQIVQCTAFAEDDALRGDSAVSAEVLILNTAPSIDSAAIRADDVFVDSTLECTHAGYNDVDRDDDQTTYTWSIDGEPAGAGATLSGPFVVDQSITCTATAYDGVENGNAIESEPVVVLNRAPEIRGLYLSPDPVYTNDTLTAVTDSFDPDGHDVDVTYAWYVNDTLVLDQSGPDLDGTLYFNRDDEIYVVATPADPFTSGEPARAESLTVQSTAPVMSEVTLSPTEATEASRLTCAPRASDADDDDIAFDIVWTVSDTALDLPRDQAELGGSFFDKGQTVTCAVTPRDDVGTGEPMTSNSVDIRNTPPVQPLPQVQPAPAFGDDLLTCVAPEATDIDPADADDLSQAFIWWVDDVLDPTQTTNTFDARGYIRGDRFACQVTPSDAEGPGEAVISATLVLSNTAPTASNVTVSPEGATTTEDITCSVGSTFDLDGDEVSLRFNWTADDAPIDFEGEVLPSSYTARDQAIRCVVTASDDLNEGEGVTSAPLVIANTAPTTPTIQIQPSPAQTEESPMAIIVTEGDDVDGDDVEYVYRWSVDGASTDYTDATLPSEATRRGDRWNVSVTPTDGDLSGEVVTISVDIINTPPELLAVSLTPTNAKVTDALLCQATSWQDDDGDDVDFSFAWTVNDEALDTDAQALSMAPYNRGDRVQCTVTPSDDEASGEPMTTEVVTLVNSPPVVSDVTLIPDAIATDDTVFVTYDTDDADDDSLDCSVTWFGLDAETGDEAQIGTGSSLTGAAFDKDDIVYAIVTCDDGYGGNVNAVSSVRVVQNTPPTVTGASISPSPAYPGDTLTCTYTYEDIDGDEDDSLVTWYVNDVAVALGATWVADADAGDSITCEVESSDGEADGSTSSVVVPLEEDSTGGGDDGEAYGSTAEFAGLDCLDILESGEATGDGTYWIDPDGSGAFEVDCDMTTDGGGWTGLTWPDVLEHLSGYFTSLDGAASGLDSVLGPFTRDDSDAHSYWYTFEVPGGWHQFYFGSDYLIASNACAEGCTSDIYASAWQQTTWDECYVVEPSSTGDIGFGDPNQDGPAVTWAAALDGVDQQYAYLETAAWPSGSTIYTNSTTDVANEFRLAWGETGGEAEGWYPWYAGTLYFRDMPPSSGAYGSTAELAGFDCLDIRDTHPAPENGTYWINPDGLGAFEVYCDMTTAGGGWSLVATISSHDATDRWAYDEGVYRDDTTFGITSSLTTSDAKSLAYSTLEGENVLIQDADTPAYFAAHTYAASPTVWSTYLDGIWEQCGHPVSTSAFALSSDGRDSVIGSSLYFRHYDANIGDCSSEERSMFAQQATHFGYAEIGLGSSQSSGGFRDAAWAPVGSFGTLLTGASWKNRAAYHIFIR